MSGSPDGGGAGWLIAGAVSLATLVGVGLASAASQPPESPPAPAAARVVRDPALGGDRMGFAIGHALFERQWVSAPSSTQATDGLGPLYNARSCAGCHPGGGRGRRRDGLVLHLGQAGSGAGDPTYGRQLQTASVPGLVPEGRLAIDWVERTVTLADGSVVTLRRPVPRIVDPAAGPLDPATRTGLRIAPALTGLGALQRVPDREILAGSGGRPSWVTDPATGQRRLGRFGWKASEPSVMAQIGRALSDDIGLSNPLHPDPYGDCTARQTACRAAPNGASPQFEGLEVPSLLLASIDEFVEQATLPPAAAGAAGETHRGRALFAAAGCAACHRPTFTLPAAAGRPARTIAPYSDLRLHAMGDDLADPMPEGAAAGDEWRTAPLWGLGRSLDAAGHAALLHDGRARSILEAILWHGGEAAAARDRVAAMPAVDRDALVDFLKSL